MHLRPSLASFLTFAVPFASCLSASAAAQQRPVPVAPPTRTVAQDDDYHGTRVADPYRWLEDLDGKATADWVAAQNAVTFGYLRGLPERAAIRARLDELINYERVGAPVGKNGRYWFTRNSGRQNQSVWYVQEGLTGAPRIFLDPNTLSADGTVAITGVRPNEQGTLVAWSIAEAGSDWQQLRIRDVRTGKDLADTLRWLKFGGAAWTHDGKGFFYSRFPAPEDGKGLQAATVDQTIWYHVLGTPQSADRRIYARPDHPTWYIGAGLSDDGRYLLISLADGTDDRNGLVVMDLRDARRPDLTARPRELFAPGDAEYSVIGNDGTRLYVQTTKGAPNRRIVALELGRHADTASWRTIVPEAEPIAAADLVRNELFVTRLRDVASTVSRFALDGRPLGELALPGLGTVGGMIGERHEAARFYTYSSFLYPPTTFRYDVATGKTSVFRQPQVPGFDPARFETIRVFAPSKDGTRIPVFLTMKKGLARDGKNPTILYAYGGFNIELRPGFSAARLAWLERGGIWAQASLRGGGEYGEAWHQAGMLGRKQNVFDDFIGAAEALVRDGWTSKEHLAIQGGSNGGLLVGAVMVQRPELFAVALPAVGVMDMLRYQKFTVGHGWVPEYGTADRAEDFAWLAKYSPLHNLKPGTDYPATLITTADHDDRVVPSHSFKFAAALQAATTNRRPALIRVETRAGHGGGMPLAKQLDITADEFAFALANMPAREALP